jgi:hypothetical protein
MLRQHIRATIGAIRTMEKIEQNVKCIDYPMGVSFITIGANRREDKDNSWALDDPMARG